MFRGSVDSYVSSLFECEGSVPYHVFSLSSGGSVSYYDPVDTVLVPVPPNRVIFSLPDSSVTQLGLIQRGGASTSDVPYRQGEIGVIRAEIGSTGLASRESTYGCNSSNFVVFRGTQFSKGTATVTSADSAELHG